MVRVREDMTGWNMWEHGVPDSKLTVIKQVEDKVLSDNKHNYGPEFSPQRHLFKQYKINESEAI